MEINNITDFDEFMNQFLNNDEIISELTNWGKTVHFLLDGKNYYFDFSKSKKDVLLFEVDPDQSFNFTIKTKFTIFKDILQEKIDPIESFAQGLVEVEGSFLELMEFAEIIVERIRNQN